MDSKRLNNLLMLLLGFWIAIVLPTFGYGILLMNDRLLNIAVYGSSLMLIVAVVLFIKWLIDELKSIY